MVRLIASWFERREERSRLWGCNWVQDIHEYLVRDFSELIPLDEEIMRTRTQTILYRMEYSWETSAIPRFHCFISRILGERNLGWSDQFNPLSTQSRRRKKLDYRICLDYIIGSRASFPEAQIKNPERVHYDDESCTAGHDRELRANRNFTTSESGWVSYWCFTVKNLLHCICYEQQAPCNGYFQFLAFISF